MTLTMKISAVQLLASILVLSTISFSQRNDEEKGHTKYLLFDKKISVQKILRIGGKRSGAMGENAGEKGVGESSLSSFMTKISNNYKLRMLNNDMSQSPGLQWLNTTDSNTGTAFVCGPEGAHLNMSWKPKVINTEKSAQIYLDIVYPIDFKEGLAHIDVYRQGRPDPVFSVDDGITCTDIVNWVPFVKCPLKKGDVLSFSFKYSETQLQPVSVSVMKLSVLMLAFIVGFVSPSVFHEDGTRWNPQSYPIVNKKVHNMQTVHLVQKRKKARGKSFENFEVTGNNESFWSSMSLLFAKTPTSAKLKYPKNKLSMVRPQWTDETDNNTGRVIVCGPEGAYFNISWRPKVIDPYKCVRIYFDIISPIYFDKGQGRVDVYLEGSSYPMYSVVRLVSCDFFQNIDPLCQSDLQRNTASYTIYLWDPTPLF